jgi:hypothetical protein
MIHIEGFEEFLGESPLKPAFTRADYAAEGEWAMVAGRGAGSYGISGRESSLMRVGEWTDAKFSVGFAYQFEARGSVAWLDIGGARVTLWLNPESGLPHLNTNPGGALPTIVRWYYYEIELDRASGVASLYINNRFDSQFLIGGFTGPEVEVNLGYLDPAEYRPGVDPVPVDLGAKSFDDFYMHDGPRLGPIKVTTRFPDVDVNVEWFRAAQSGTHAQSLSLHPPKPLDNYVASDTIGEEDRFTSATSLANTNPVIATAVVVLARKSPALLAKLGVFIGGQVGAELRSTTGVVETEWRTQYFGFEKRTADTVAGITASQFGITVENP